MALGLSRGQIQSCIETELRRTSLEHSDVRRIAEAVALAIDRNNRRIEQRLTQAGFPV
jgi:hypothetical protein